MDNYLLHSPLYYRKIVVTNQSNTSENAQAIASMVDEVVKADANDVASMVEAFRGCHGAFLASNWWEDLDVTHEIVLLRNLKEAVKTADVKHIVNSVLEDSC